MNKKLLFEKLKKIGSFALWAGGFLLALLAARVREKGAAMDEGPGRDEIERRGAEGIISMDDDDFLDSHDGVRSAGERGKERFRKNTERILHRGRGRKTD